MENSSLWRCVHTYNIYIFYYTHHGNAAVGISFSRSRFGSCYTVKYVNVLPVDTRIINIHCIHAGQRRRWREKENYIIFQPNTIIINNNIVIKLRFINTTTSPRWFVRNFMTGNQPRRPLLKWRVLTTFHRSFFWYFIAQTTIMFRY